MFETQYYKHGDAENKTPIGGAQLRATVDAYTSDSKGGEDASDDAHTRMGRGYVGG